ncbi:Uma2 family endonuclease [Hymenobacter sp. BRD67]|uniref:Uma2 family endonuclease n=1 Tax=Hymenobacter sp. BRD67 TaxID=2675877 RepID=UPI0015673149|nr:Uma2 family endonuclease [Hymenobacter sp. BRD67]QKG52765.1 Uma2 family endonuclease [Hymenobacter sp. BRD67]
MSAAQSIYERSYTVEEYFAFEERADIRHEYYHGEIFPLDGPAAMAGATFAHNTIKQNCVMALRQGLRGRGCRVFDENVRLSIEQDKQFTYPDVMVTCHPDDQRETRIARHPSLIVEVLSASTEGHDRGWKFQQYQRLPELQQYVLISQNQVLVESFLRDSENIWKLTQLRNPTDLLELPSLSLSISLASIYEEVEISPLRLADSY